MNEELLKYKSSLSLEVYNTAIMKLLTRCNIIKHVALLYRSNTKHDYAVSIREYFTVFSNTGRRIRHPLPLSSVSYLQYSDDKKPFITFEKKSLALKDAFEHKKEQLKDTEHRIRQRSEEIVRDIKHQKDLTGQKLRVKKEYIIKDILETKAKVKERIEEVVEVNILLDLSCIRIL